MTGASLGEFVDGPQAGLVAVVAGDRPVVLLAQPRDRVLFDVPAGTLVWNPRVAWYERSERC